LIEHLGVAGMQFALLFQVFARLRGLAFAQQQERLAERSGLFRQRIVGKGEFLLLSGAGA
jgi:hypothetical protein